MESLEDMYAPEELHEDLKPFVHKSDGVGWVVLQHPLVYSVPYAEPMNRMLNRQYLHKKQALSACREKGDLNQFIWLHERPYRLMAFSTIEKDLSDEGYWELLSSIWLDSENIWQNLHTWCSFLNSPRTKRELFMCEEEQEAFAALPDTFKIYRGYVPGKNKNGLSYSLKREKAKWFAQRFDRQGKVAVLTVKKGDVLALLLGRQEDEIILIPKRGKQ